MTLSCGWVKSFGTLQERHLQRKSALICKHVIWSSKSAIIDIPARSETNILHLAFSRENPCMQMTKLKIVFFSLLVSGTCWLALAPFVSELLSWVLQALLIQLASLFSLSSPPLPRSWLFLPCCLTNWLYSKYSFPVLQFASSVLKPLWKKKKSVFLVCLKVASCPLHKSQCSPWNRF